jgi:hypothetical protein
LQETVRTLEVEVIEKDLAHSRPLSYGHASAAACHYLNLACAYCQGVSNVGGSVVNSAADATTCKTSIPRLPRVGRRSPCV